MSYLGIDAGSLFLGVVEIDEKGHVLRQIYQRHHGDPLATLQALFVEIPRQEIQNAVRTGSAGRGLPLSCEYLDPLVAGVEGVRALAPDVRNILSIGGGSFSLVELDEEGRYRKSTLNSACASGTGAFLDQQALRLQIDPSELAQRAMAYDKRPPSVATRCAVFAKSDMIHLQQEGFTVSAIAAGLCAGLGRSTVDGLLNGRKLTGKTALIGGVALNTVVTRTIREKLGVETYIPEHPELVAAYGAALVALRRGPARQGSPLTVVEPAEKQETFLRPPLELRLSDYPDFATHAHWINEEQTEIAIVVPRSGVVRVALGIDIGSTSTKAVILDESNEVVGWVYRKTAGDPIRAVQRLFRAFREMEERGGFKIEVRGVGTTGSGRKMIKEVIGADLAMNEITAHATAAIFLDPAVDTIIELGGQDAKFTQLQNGMVYNSVMNYVCAAGTGSFIEEQALKLGIPLTEYASRAMGQRAPLTSDRCTVYMERDLDLLLAKGWAKDQVAAAVLYSVRDNYLNKVVGGLHIGDHVYFQGATARNKALVAAFEAELHRPIRVSPFCHVTGALGMCLLVRERIPEEARSKHFKGFAFADTPIHVDYETCELCHNLCTLSLIHAGNETVAWGLKCGRDYHSKKVRAKKITTYDFWKRREAAWSRSYVRHAGGGPRIGIPRSLGTYGYYPYWNAFFSSLGCEVVLSPPSSEKILHQGNEITTAEYCAPVVMSHGHVRMLLEHAKVDYLFLPHMIREPVLPGFTDAHFCCYLQAHPSVIRGLHRFSLDGRILSPVIQLNRSRDYQVARLKEAIGKPLNVGEAAIRRALDAAEEAFDLFRSEARRIGEEALARIEEENTLGIVCVGRPYNTTDPGLTIDLPRKIAELGYIVLYQDMLPLEPRSILPDYTNMYWHYGQKILAAAKSIASHPRLFGVYFTNFMCGPDSYILTYFKEIMGKVGKPYLCLQFDGHGADAGYLTRVEAAIESFHSFSHIPRPKELPIFDTVEV